MKSMNWLAMATAVIMISSCGENSSKKETETTDTSTVTTDPAINTTNPASMTITVPDKIQASFREKYPDVKDVTWSRYEPVSTFDWEWSGWPMMDTSDYMARFNWENADYMAWYDSDNNWVGTVAKVSDFNSLPAAVNKKISGEFAGYTIVTVDKENDRNRTAYEVDLTKGEDKATILIDENGNIIKKKTLVGGDRSKEKVPQ